MPHRIGCDFPAMARASVKLRGRTVAVVAGEIEGLNRWLSSRLEESFDIVVDLLVFHDDLRFPGLNYRVDVGVGVNPLRHPALSELNDLDFGLMGLRRTPLDTVGCEVGEGGEWHSRKEYQVSI